jgi:hypothetical protein
MEENNREIYEPIISANPCGIGNRLRCYLSSLAHNRKSTISWCNKLYDGSTIDECRANGNILQFDHLFIRNEIRYNKHEKTSHNIWWYDPRGSIKHFLLYRNDKYTHDLYMNLRNRFLVPQDYIYDNAVYRTDFKYGFQIRIRQELTPDWKHINFNRSIHENVIEFIKTCNEPIFVACDNNMLLKQLSENKNVFFHRRKYPKNFNLEWDVSLMEIVTLGKCETLYLTDYSTYGEMGWLFGDCKPVVKFISSPMDQDPIYQPAKPT